MHFYDCKSKDDKVFVNGSNKKYNFYHDIFNAITLPRVYKFESLESPKILGSKIDTFDFEVHQDQDRELFIRLKNKKLKTFKLFYQINSRTYHKIIRIKNDEFPYPSIEICSAMHFEGTGCYKSDLLNVCRVFTNTSSYLNQSILNYQVLKFKLSLIRNMNWGKTAWYYNTLHDSSVVQIANIYSLIEKNDTLEIDSLILKDTFNNYYQIDNVKYKYTDYGSIHIINRGKIKKHERTFLQKNE